MADYTLTCLDLQQSAAHAAGLSVANFNANTGLTALQCAHDAIHYVWFRRRWRWRQASETLGLTISQSYVALSATYGRTLSLAGYPGTNYSVQMVAVDQLNQIRQAQAPGASFDLYCAVSWTPQASVTALPIARLEIFPTPAASVASAMMHFYERRPPKVSGDTDVVDMPPQFAPVLDLLARHFAKQKTGIELGGELQMAEQMLKGLVDEDVMAQPFGPAVAGTNLQWGRDFTNDDRRYEPSGVTVSS